MIRGFVRTMKPVMRWRSVGASTTVDMTGHDDTTAEPYRPTPGLAPLAAGFAEDLVPGSGNAGSAMGAGDVADSTVGQPHRVGRLAVVVMVTDEASAADDRDGLVTVDAPTSWHRLTPRAYERVTLVAVWLIGIIVVTGGAVRLTASGLGCTDWPTCEANKVYPSWHFHGWVEFGNRLVTGLVSIAVILAVLGALVRVPRRRDLTWLSIGLVGGVVGQIVLGGIVVLSHLWPPFVMGHFVLSMLLVADAVVLVHRARRPDGSRQRSLVDPTARRLGRALVWLSALAIVTGTVVTGTGPHSGSNDGTPVDRLPFQITDVARIHGTVDMAVLATIVLLLVVLLRRGAPRGVLARLEIVLVFGILQAAIGYTQYFTGVPEILVGLHILGATLIWSAVLWFFLGLSESVRDAAESHHADTSTGRRSDAAGAVPADTGRDVDDAAAGDRDDDAGRDRAGRDVVASG